MPFYDLRSENEVSPILTALEPTRGLMAYKTNKEITAKPNNHLRGEASILQGGFPLNFKNEISRLCSALFLDPSQVQVLVLCNL